MKTVIIIGVLTVIGIIYFVSKKKSGNKQIVHVAKQILLEDLESIMTKLLNGNLEYDFFGITSNGIDCLYFVDNNGRINIEFEVITNEQKPYVKSLVDFAEKNNYNVVKTSYGNKPRYSELVEAPVYKIELNENKTRATEIGVEIMETIFSKNGMTKFDVIQ